MADLRAQLRRGLCALQLTLSRDRSANVDRWLTELAELHGLTMTSVSFGSKADHSESAAISAN